MSDAIGSQAYHVDKWRVSVEVGGRSLRSWWHLDRDIALNEVVNMVNEIDFKEDALTFKFECRQFKENV